VTRRKILGGGEGVPYTYTYVVSFEIEFGVGTTVTLIFLLGGKHPSNPPTPKRDAESI